MNKNLFIRWNIFVISVVFLLIASPTLVSAAYPGGCHSCRTAGSWCVEPGSGYECGMESQCGAEFGASADCPNGCTCTAAEYVGGSVSCSNNCIHVVSCGGVPGPTATPTPIPMGDVQGRIVLNDQPTRCEGCAPCQGAPEFGIKVRVSNPDGGQYEANSCPATGPIYQSTTRAGIHDVQARQIPSNYYVGYTACINDSNPSCHQVTPTVGDTATVGVPDGGFVDLWWHFSSPGTIKIQSIASSLGCPELLSESSYFSDGLSTLEVNGLGNGSIVGNEKVYADTLTAPGGKQYQLTAGAAPLGFTPGEVCWKTSSGDQGTGDLAYLKADETLTWVVGFIPPGPWVQTAGGDVYAFNQVKSSIPDHAPDHDFNLKGAEDKPGVVFYGSSFDFDSDPISNGGNNVSSENWLAGDTFGDSVTSLFDTFYTVLGSPTTSSWNDGASCGSLPCYASGPGPYVIAAPLNITSGQRVVNIVRGDLNINNEIHVDNGGFLAFIVTGNINIANSVGTTTADSVDPQIEGVYVADGSFISGGGNKKLVAEGMFIAHSFDLNRDFDSADNADYPSELFIYGPRFIVSMPKEMAETLLRWQEVNP